MRKSFVVAGVVATLLFGTTSAAFSSCIGLGAAAAYEKKLRELGALINEVQLDKIAENIPSHVSVPGNTRTVYLVDVVDQHLKHHPFIVFVNKNGCIISYTPISKETYDLLLESNG